MVEKYDITLSGGLSSAKPKKEVKRKTQSYWWYMGLVGQIGYTIAIPLVAGVLVGAFIDRTIQTRPWATLAGLGLGSVISVLGFVRTIREAIKKD